MKDFTVDDVVEAIYYVLEPHASFFCEGEDDQNRYFISPEAIEALSWIALNILLPIFTGVSSGVMTSVISEQLRKRQADEDIKAMREDLERLKAELREAFRQLQLKEGKKPRNEEISIVRLDLAHLFEAHGWPSSIAESDAKKALESTLQFLQKKDERQND